MDEIFEICDQISVLRDGSLVMTKDSKDTNMNELISAMVGRSLDNRFPPVDNTPGETILSVQGLSTKYAPKLQNITFDVKKGEIFGLYGLVGAGRTELLETIFGIRTRAAGNVMYGGKIMNFTGPRMLWITDLPSSLRRERQMVSSSRQISPSIPPLQI